MQKSLFQFFSPKNNGSNSSSKESNKLSSASPVIKKKAALKSLMKLADDDNLSLELSFDENNDVSDGNEGMIQKKINVGNDNLSDVFNNNNKSEKKQISNIVNKHSKVKSNPPPKKGKQTQLFSSQSESCPSESVPIADSFGRVLKPTKIDDTVDDLPDWLTKNLMDANKRKPTDPNYDPTTVFIPQSVQNNFTVFQKQFWEIKKINFDAVVLIRKGSFFEMYNSDAIFGRDVLKLRLTNHSGELICGVPDKKFGEWALKIINAGRRVCKVEQVESAVDQKNRKTGEKIAKRELVQIYSVGTIDDFEMLECSQSSYLMTIRSSSRKTAGVCLVDCSIGSFFLGVVNEEDLIDILIKFEPVEVIYNKDAAYPGHIDTIKMILNSSCITQCKSGQSEWWDERLAMNEIQRTMISSSSISSGEEENNLWENGIPEFLENAPKEALAAFGGCVGYLNNNKIAKPLLQLNRFYSLEEAFGSKYVSLDSSALINLHVIGKDEHCLLNIINKCSTSFGRRKLRYWIMHPLRNIANIEQRLDAVEELMSDPSYFINLPKKLQCIPDLERMLSRVYSNRGSVRIFLDCANALKKALEMIEPLESKVKCSLLKNLMPFGKSSSATKQLDKILESLDTSRSLDVNEFVVKKGVFTDIDEIEDEVKSIELSLENELKLEKSKIGCNKIEYYHQTKERYQLSIPNEYTNDININTYKLVSQAKNVKRYKTQNINDIVAKLEQVENIRQKKRQGCQLRFTKEFSNNSNIWDSIYNTISELDCLLSLANTSQRWDKPSCRPRFITKNDEIAKGRPFLKLSKMRNPCVYGRCIPNDVLINADNYCIIITGPNASGKSTFARMCCIAIILAQIGCYLPAEDATLTAFDQIFTRIGAGDRMFSGQSTFAVELSETARLMKNSTEDSFVVLDELGRGTSTFDGISIATAVLEYFLQGKKCPLLFCTHYHILTQQFQGYPGIRNASMGYFIDNKKLILQYKLIDGPCSNSFGCTVAKMCGIDEGLADNAQIISDEFEDRHKALHINSKENQIIHIELNRDYESITNEIIEEMNEKSIPMRIAKISAIIEEKVKKLDLS